MKHTVKTLALAVAMMASVASAQEEQEVQEENINIFTGFEYVLQPIGIKWACGGGSSNDVTALDALIAAFPEDAASAELQTTIDGMKELTTGQAALAEMLGIDASSAQASDVCAVAMPLSVEWATPDLFASNDNEGGVPDDQRELWSAFWQVVNSI
ncbi:MAG: hypothetical protein AAGA47_07900 [Pseudomonadota bacterium]